MTRAMDVSPIHRTPHGPRPGDPLHGTPAPRMPLPVPGVDVVETLSTRVPPEALEHVSASAAAADRLEAMERELHFEVGDDGRIRIELRDSDGRVLRTIPPGEAVDLATGAIQPPDPRIP